jgi:light-harvesting complex 1 beta chain
MADNKSPLSSSGLTEAEAKEYHRLFMSSTIAYVVVAVIAHFLAWTWRPWFPSVNGYSLNEHIAPVVSQLTTMLS